MTEPSRDSSRKKLLSSASVLREFQEFLNSCPVLEPPRRRPDQRNTPPLSGRPTRFSSSGEMPRSPVKEGSASSIPPAKAGPATW